MSNIIDLEAARAARMPERLNVPALADALSFIKRRTRKQGGGFDYWAVEPSGDYSADWEAGKALAEEYLAFVGRYPTYGNETLFGLIVDAMAKTSIARGPSRPWRQISGVELGFLKEINRYAMATAHLMAGRSSGAH